LYQTVCRTKNVFPDIAYLPPENDRKLFKRSHIPWLLGTQTKFGPEKFNVIAFSNSIVQEIINIPHFLRESGIPLRRSERLSDPKTPLVLLGGNNAAYTSALWGPDPVVDGIFIGHDTSIIEKLFLTAGEDILKGKTKEEVLMELEENVPGFHQPLFPLSQKKACVVKSSLPDLLENGMVMYHENAVGTGYLRISEGCRASCSFCAENWARKPYREVSAETLVRNAKEMKVSMGLKNIEIFSFNFNLYTDLYKLIGELIPLFKSIGLKSQRFDMLSQDPLMLEYQHALGKTTISAGLEGISERLRKYLNKNLDEPVILKSLDLIFRSKPRELKIFLLSTGLEEKNDLDEFGRFLHAVKVLRDRCGSNTRTIFSITPLVRFPWTPLEFSDAPDAQTHKKIIGLICALTQASGFEARVSMEADEYLISQILVRASEPRLMQALLSAIDQTSFVYYRSVTDKFVSSFTENLKKCGLNIPDLLKGPAFEEGMTKPWSLFDMGIQRDILRGIYELNREYSEAGAPLSRIKIAPLVQPVQKYRDLIQKNIKEERPIAFRVRISEHGRGLVREYIGTALARALMRTDKDLTPYFRSYISASWSADASKPVWMTGDDIITLAWSGPALSIIQERCGDKGFIDGVNEEFAPWGNFVSLHDGSAVSYTCRIDSPFTFDGLAYFKARGIKYTLTKGADRIHRYLFTKESLKKDILLKCESAGNSVSIVPGRKFICDEFLKEAFMRQKKDDWVRIMIDARQN